MANERFTQKCSVLCTWNEQENRRSFTHKENEEIVDEWVGEWGREGESLAQISNGKVKWDAQLVTFNQFALFIFFLSPSLSLYRFHFISFNSWRPFTLSRLNCSTDLYSHLLKFMHRFTPVAVSVCVCAQYLFFSVSMCLVFCFYYNESCKFDRLNRFFLLVRQKMQSAIVIDYEICALYK